MSAEVITMEEFNNSNAEKETHYSDEDFKRDFEWAQERSWDMVHLAGSPMRALLLVHHIVEDTLLHCKEGLSEEGMADVKEGFKEHVNSGIASFENPHVCECGE